MIVTCLKTLDEPYLYKLFGYDVGNKVVCTGSVVTGHMYKICIFGVVRCRVTNSAGRKILAKKPEIQSPRPLFYVHILLGRQIFPL